MDYMMLGFVVGIAIAVIAVIISLLRNSQKNKSQYDERQKIIQGTGFKLAFFTLLVTSMVFCFIHDVFDFTLLSATELQFVAIVISVVVYVGYTLFKDAYIGINDNAKRFIIPLAVIGSFEIFMFFYTLNSKHSYKISLIAGIGLILISLFMIVKYCINKKIENREDNI